MFQIIGALGIATLAVFVALIWSVLNKMSKIFDLQNIALHSIVSEMIKLRNTAERDNKAFEMMNEELNEMKKHIQELRQDMT